MRGEGGHLLVEGCVGGSLRGWFVLDTGTSGVVLDLPAAQDLTLTKLGEHFTNGVGHSVQVRNLALLSHLFHKSLTEPMTSVNSEWFLVLTTTTVIIISIKICMSNFHR
jgi:hypothetical protein